MTEVRKEATCMHCFRPKEYEGSRKRNIFLLQKISDIISLMIINISGIFKRVINVDNSKNK